MDPEVVLEVEIKQEPDDEEADMIVLEEKVREVKLVEKKRM